MSTHRNRLGRRLLALVASGALAGGMLAATATTAQAASRDVSGVELTWSLNNEQGGGAFFGGCNYLSAGQAGDTGSSRLWTQNDGFWKASEGDVSIEKPNAQGDYVAPTWANKCQDPNGTNVSAGNVNSTSGNRVRLSEGTGTIDAATGAGTISWEGSFTSVFYGGLTYWSATDPELTIAADGTGTLTATGSGYGADMDDTSKWVPLTPREITLATFKDVNVTGSGFTATPTYLGTAITNSGTPQAAKTTDNEAYWGSFPQDFVDFQVETGQSSYWYTSAGARDRAKPASAVTVSIPTTTPTLSHTVIDDDTTETVTVSWQVDPDLAVGTRPPFAGQKSGLYIAFGRYADVWRPSAGAPPSARVNPSGSNGTGNAVKWAVPAASFTASNPPQSLSTAAYVELKADGTFTAKIKVNPTWLSSATGNYGIYTYAGGGPAVADYETFTPLTIVQKADSTAEFESGYEGTFGTAGTVKVDVAAIGDATATGEVELTATPTGGTATEIDTVEIEDGVATFTLPAGLTGAGALSATYLGNETVETVTATSTYAVSAAETTTSASGPAIVTQGTDQELAVTVDSAVDGILPAGSVQLTDTEGNEIGDPATLEDGEADLAIPTEDLGEASYLVEYAGETGKFAASATSTPQVVEVKVAPVSTVEVESLPAAVPYGVVPTAKVTVSSNRDDFDAPTGTITARVGNSVVGTAAVTDGVANLSLIRTITAGARNVTFTYTGGGDHPTAVGSQSVTITPAFIGMPRSLKKVPTRTKTGEFTASITVPAGTPAATGNVRLWLTSPGKKSVVITQALSRGSVRVTLPKLAKGTWLLRTQYMGSTNLRPTTIASSGSFKVK